MSLYTGLKRKCLFYCAKALYCPEIKVFLLFLSNFWLISTVLTRTHRNNLILIKEPPVSVSSLAVIVVCSVADPGSGIRCLFDPWIRDKQPGSYFRELETIFWVLKYLNSLMWTRNGKNLEPGSWIRNTGFNVRRR
jgi:hypothetical protein